MVWVCNCDGGLTTDQIHDFFKEAAENGGVIKKPHLVKKAIKTDTKVSFCRSSVGENGCLSQIKEIQEKHYPSTLPQDKQKALSEKKGSCGNDCATCPNKDKKGSIVKTFDPNATGEVIIPVRFTCETGVTRDQNGTQISPQKLVAEG